MELGAAWDYALDAGRIGDEVPNWWRQVMRNRIKSRGKKIAGESIGVVKRVLDEREIGELIRWLPNFSRAVDDVLTLYLWTGCRGGEICAMEAQEVAQEADGLWWTIPKRKTKNAKRDGATDMRVPLIGRAEEVVRRRLALAGRRGFLFPSDSKSGHLEQQAVRRATYHHMPYSRVRPEEVRPRLTVTHWAPHDLRRTVRTQLAAIGCPDDVGEVILGHMLSGVRGIYNRHNYDEERREWLSKLAARWEGLVGR